MKRRGQTAPNSDVLSCQTNKSGKMKVTNPRALAGVIRKEEMVSIKGSDGLTLLVYVNEMLRIFRADTMTRSLHANMPIHKRHCMLGIATSKLSFSSPWLGCCASAITMASVCWTLSSHLASSELYKLLLTFAINVVQ